MLRKWIVCVALACGLVTVTGTGDIGPGIWHVNYVSKCEEDAHIFKFKIAQSKINRTHDGFNADLCLDEPFTSDFGIRVDICKHVDGGCKPYQVLSDDSFVNFVNKYAEGNARAALEIAGVDPPEFPIEKGEYQVRDYVFDYSELPEDGIYGEFTAKAYVLKDTVEVGCVECCVEFKELEDDDYEE